MSKYDALREWRRTTAQKDWRCEGCGVQIPARSEYWAERIGGGVSTVGVKLGKLCDPCYGKRGAA